MDLPQNQYTKGVLKVMLINDYYDNPDDLRQLASD